MSNLTAPYTESKSFEPAPAGWHPARCFAVIDLGTQWSDTYGKEVHYVRIGWELPTCLRDDNRPYAIYSRFTLSAHQKATLRKTIESWRGRAYTEQELKQKGGLPLDKLPGQTAYINVVHAPAKDGSGDVYANVGGIGPLPKEIKCPAAVNEQLVFSLQGDAFDAPGFERLTDKTKEIVMRSGEYLRFHGKKPPTPTLSHEPHDGPPPTNGKDPFDQFDDIPF